jgi:hypothetical protein
MLINLEEEHIQPGAISVLKIDTNNFENIQLGVSSTKSSIPPMPPMPIPILPGQ